MTDSTDPYRLKRIEMVRQQIQARNITDPGVLEQMAIVERHLFVPDYLRQNAYEDRPLPIGHNQTISQPYIVALMCSLLKPPPDGKILEIGSGSGYQTAILSALAGQVYAVERLRPLFESSKEILAHLGISNITMVLGDGTQGLAGHGPFDGIICAAGGREIPPALIDQLAVGGRLIMPVGDAAGQKLTIIERFADETLNKQEVCNVRFVKLIGKNGWPGDFDNDREL